MSYKIQPVVLCGGNGTRLWPLSRNSYPKQFLTFNEKKSLFQQAYERAVDLVLENCELLKPYVVTTDDHKFLILDQLQSIKANPAKIFLEPASKNTAAAVTLAALEAHNSKNDPILLISPSDHVLESFKKYNEVISSAILSAIEGKIVTIGIQPDRATSDYGYIQFASDSGSRLKTVKNFIEKPDLEKAAEYLKLGGYLWNSGMLVIRASVWLKAISEFREDIYTATKISWDSSSREEENKINFVNPQFADYSKIQSESIDYAVLEKCANSDYHISVIELKSGWSDLGSWNSVWENFQKDKNGNVFTGDVKALDSSNCVVNSSSRLVSIVDIENIAVIETPDAVLVANKKSSQNIKKLVSEMLVEVKSEAIDHRKVFRPWGWYDVLDEGPGFKVKRIMVKPGAKLSLQKHMHRAEHWVVVQGEANVVNGETSFKLTQNQSTYIPCESKHRLSNSSDENLEIIEVQTGAYLGEDDIIRFEDKYGRLD